MAKTSLTIINDSKLRGVLAPARTLSEKMLEGIIDFIELSTPQSIREDQNRIRAANRTNSWLPSEEVEKRLKKRMNRSQ